MTKSNQRIKDRLRIMDLVFVKGTIDVKCRTHLGAGETAGKRVALYQATNYNDFHTCATCKVSARRGA